MAEILSYLDFTAKLVFGLVISLAFAGVTYKANKKDYISILSALVFVQTVIYVTAGVDFMVSIYPVVIHIPIILFLNLKMKTPLLLSIISLFFAFQFLSARQWLGSFVAYFFNNNDIVLTVATIVLSVPFAILINRFLAPEIAAFKREDKKVILMIGLAPMIYYILTYTTVIYSNTLVLMEVDLINFFDKSFSLIFILYTVCFLKVMQGKKEMETEREVLLVMKEASRIELAELHKTHDIIASYRHDIRHHIKLVDELISKNENGKAREYLHNLLCEQDRENIYDSNKSINMILDKFKQQAEKDGVYFEIQVLTDDFSGFDEISLCSLISNGLENAMNFSKEHDKPRAYIAIQRKGRTLTILIKNNYSKLPEFRNRRPFTKEHGHGYGTKSMAEIVEKYRGFCQFYVEYNYFIFRVTMMSSESDS